MGYVIPYEADFECPDGHKFTCRVNAMAERRQVVCPTCYAAWVEANVPKGTQVGDPRRADDVKVTY